MELAPVIDHSIPIREWGALSLSRRTYEDEPRIALPTASGIHDAKAPMLNAWQNVIGRNR
jgi:hypothetical protein